MYADWGLTELYERINHEMEEETQHADALLKRILFLEGVPDMTPEPLNTGTSVPEMLRADLALEYQVRAALAQGIELCEKHGDYESREILELQLKDTEEDHAYWLVQQLGLIDRIGLRFADRKSPANAGLFVFARSGQALSRSSSGLRKCPV